MSAYNPRIVYLNYDKILYAEYNDWNGGGSISVKVGDTLYQFDEDSPIYANLFNWIWEHGSHAELAHLNEDTG